MNRTFELNGQAYRTDAETVAVLRSIVPSASVDGSAVQAVIALGLASGRIAVAS